MDDDRGYKPPQLILSRYCVSILRTEGVLDAGPLCLWLHQLCRFHCCENTGADHSKPERDCMDVEARENDFDDIQASVP